MIIAFGICVFVNADERFLLSFLRYVSGFVREVSRDLEPLVRTYVYVGGIQSAPPRWNENSDETVGGMCGFRVEGYLSI